MDDISNDVQQELKKVDDVMQGQIVDAIKADEAVVDLVEDYAEHCALTDNLAIVQADVLNHIEEHTYHDQIVKKLDSLYAIEEAASNAIRTRLINTVKSDVVNTFKTDTKIKDSALAHAIGILSGGAKAKLGKDIVGTVFASSIQKYSKEYAKQSPEKGSHFIFRFKIAPLFLS